MNIPPINCVILHCCIIIAMVIFVFLNWIVDYCVSIPSPLPPSSSPPPGVRLTANTIFKILKKTNKEWDGLAGGILGISPSKRREMAQRCSTDDDCLMEAIHFWMKKCPYASYRWIAYWLNIRGLGAISQKMHHLLEPIQGKMCGQ